ncbi:hypothetical protein Acr_05g0004310 [Actinidia rufa]|uniref:UDP-N-acetylenolpyruvoylglucosamine reductase C-terminal domain-containing protein n=1 Tax=Actinidia rufa TaxID=165716 RepID=A0A7J0EKH5_9ERIC|nr:hypothetical protein Acr_05g0004310 [Actinidia rufa]
MTEMVVPVVAGILSALRRVIARRVSLKNQLKRRLHAVTIAAATCFLFPVAMWDMIIGSTSESSIELPFSAWAFLSTGLFGIILIFYVDSIAEERLHMVFSSPKHLMVAGGCIIILEIGSMKQLLWNMLGRILCGIQMYQMRYLETKFRCLHYQLENRSRFSHIASESLASNSSKKGEFLSRWERSTGSVFRNPSNSGISAAELIDRAGLKGVRVGGAMVSNIHANLFVNSGGSTSRDILQLISLVKEMVYQKFGV